MHTIMVGIKRVVDYNVRVRVKPDGSGMATEGLKMSINPFDEIALEAALRLKESGSFTHVVLVAIGPVETEQQLRTALAMGADRAIRVDAPAALEPLTVARALHAVAAREQAGLVLLGKQAVDDDHGQTGQMLAALWDRPQATFASRDRGCRHRRDRDARDRRWPRDARGRLAGRRHDGLAVESTALREAARDPQGQEQAARRAIRSPSSASSRSGSSPCTASRRRRRAPPACASRTLPSSSPCSMPAERWREPRARHRGARRFAARSRDSEVRALRARPKARGARRRRARARRRRRRIASRAPRGRHGSRARRRRAQRGAARSRSRAAARELGRGVHARARPVVDVRQGFAAARCGAARRRADQRRARSPRAVTASAVPFTPAMPS